jgi:plasmid stabilization system protein ParE
MAKRLNFHPKALEEAEAATRWYAVRSRQAADEFLSELSKAIQGVSSAPERYPRFIAGTRRFLLKRSPFIWCIKSPLP